MSGRLLASNKVAIVGYGQSQVERHSDQTLGALAVETARACIADAGLRPEQIDGYVSSSLLPSAGSHAAVDGVNFVTANWLAEHMGGHATYVTGFQGLGQIPGIVSMAVNAVSSGAADYVLVQRALNNPTRGQLPRQRHDGDQRIAAVDRPAGLLRAAGDDRSELQRVPPALRSDP